MNIFVFGDSLVKGYGLNKSMSWAGILSQDFSLVYAGYNGVTATQSMTRFQALPRNPQDVLILQFAINDMVAIAEGHETFDDYLASMQYYVNCFERVIVIGPHQVIDNVENFQSWFPHSLTHNLDANEFLLNMHTSLEVLCHESKCTYMNLYHDTIMQEKGMLQTPGDGFHFSIKGSQYVAMRIKEMLQ